MNSEGYESAPVIAPAGPAVGVGEAVAAVGVGVGDVVIAAIVGLGLVATWLPPRRVKLAISATTSTAAIAVA